MSFFTSLLPKGAYTNSVLFPTGYSNSHAALVGQTRYYFLYLVYSPLLGFALFFWGPPMVRSKCSISFFQREQNLSTIFLTIASHFLWWTSVSLSICSLPPCFFPKLPSLLFLSPCIVLSPVESSLSKHFHLDFSLTYWDMASATLSTGIFGKRKQSWKRLNQCPTGRRPQNEGKKEARAWGAYILCIWACLFDDFCENFCWYKTWLMLLNAICWIEKFASEEASKIGSS